MADRESCVVLLSGGLDSAANLALAVERARPVLALTADYGQRARTSEIAAARALAAYYGVEHAVVDLGFVGRLGGSSLTDGSSAVPQLGADRLDDLATTRESARAVWVPNRNGVLINVAASFAESRGATAVVVGFNREEAATFPDNSQDYLERATAALALSTSNHVVVRCFTTAMDKREIVAELKKLARSFPFEKIWSCYHGGEKPCGSCESCRRLARALGAGGVS